MIHFALCCKNLLEFFCCLHLFCIKHHNIIVSIKNNDIFLWNFGMSQHSVYQDDLNGSQYIKLF